MGTHDVDPALKQCCAIVTRARYTTTGEHRYSTIIKPTLIQCVVFTGTLILYRTFASSMCEQTNRRAVDGSLRQGIVLK